MFRTSQNFTPLRARQNLTVSTNNSGVSWRSETCKFSQALNLKKKKKNSYQKKKPNKMQKASNTSNHGPTYLQSILRAWWCSLIAGFFLFNLIQQKPPSQPPSCPPTHTCTHSSKTHPLFLVWSCSLAACRAQSVGYEYRTVIFINEGRMDEWSPVGATAELWAQKKKSHKSVTAGSLLSLFKLQIDTLCSPPRAFIWASALICTALPASLRAADHPGLEDK